jgi:shikimate kinase/3-dehydroquinate synthase
MAARVTDAGTRSIVCIGFMGAGKSTAARSAAAALGTNAIDVDRVVEERIGKPIARVFAEGGEAAFRAAEEEITLELLSARQPNVLALGGGAVAHHGVREVLGDHLVVWLDIGVESAWLRCADSGRPLAGDRAQFEVLFAERAPLYSSLADVIVPAERSHEMGAVLKAAEGIPPGTKLIWAASASGDYPVYIGEGLLRQHRFWPAAVEGRRFLVTDGNVGRLYGEALEPLTGRVAITPGEQSKTVAHAEIVWTELLRAGMTREDLVVALGGGVVGDLAGFCASTYQRGVRYVQVPTSLVAQVDSAYGGKTAVNLDAIRAKNYVGAYYQPATALVDPDALSTLPEAELAAGYAEVVKTALIAGGELWDRVCARADPADPEVIAACALTKLRIVAEDERDAGPRQVLNLGHTVAHAIETVTGYARYRHGEAVALGLLVALRLSGNEGLRSTVRGLFEQQGLPTRLADADPGDVVMATGRDKKRRGPGPVPFVLLPEPGSPRTGCVVEPTELLAAVREVAAP